MFRVLVKPTARTICVPSCVLRKSWQHPAKALWTLNTRAFWIQQRSFSPSRSHQELPSVRMPETENATSGSKRKANRPPTAKTSLRRVAVEAERSRSGRRQGQGDEQVKEGRIKEVTAYCAAEQYDIAKITTILESKNYDLDPSRTGLYPQVVHFRMHSQHGIKEGAGETQTTSGDVFVFPSGTVVAWDVDEVAISALVNTAFLPAAEQPHREEMETEDLDFVEEPASEKSSIVGETIHLGLKNQSESRATEDKAHVAPATVSALEHNTHSDEANLVLTKIAFSSGLARSTKLGMLESTLDKYFHSIRSIPALLSSGSRLPFTRSFILRKTGELLSLRAQLNLYSELTDRLPDLFWDSRHELGLEGYFDQVGRALDVGIRIKVLNEKMNYAQEIAAVLRERLSEQHGLALEWLIIILIAIEVGFEILRLWRENKESSDPDSTEAMLRRYLQRSLENRPARAE